jgi:TolB-like protein
MVPGGSINKILNVAVIVLCAVVAALPATGLCESQSVAVFPIKNNGQAQYDGLASGLAVMFTTNLKESDDIVVVEPQNVYDAIRRVRLEGGAPKVADALKAARDVGAQYALTGEFVLFGGKFRIDIRLYDVSTGTIRYTDKAQEKEDALFDKVDSLTDGIIVELVGALPAVKGMLVVESVPKGAFVFVDEAKAGETPLMLSEIKRGAHDVTVELPGFKPHTERVTVSEGEATELLVELEPLYGGVRLWWQELPTSDIRIGEYTVDMGHFQYNPLAIYCKNFPVGSYKVTVRMPYKDEGSWEEGAKSLTYTAEVDLRAGEVVDVFINNRIFSPSIEVGGCPSCVETWDFDADIVWYEPK